MTNLQTIAGGFAWMFTALVLIAATLEPVSIADAGATAARAESRVATLCLDALAAAAVPCPVYAA